MRYTVKVARPAGPLGVATGSALGSRPPAGSSRGDSRTFGSAVRVDPCGRLNGELILLRYRMRRGLRGKRRAQHGQRDSIRAMATTSIRCMVAIEFGTWRWGRIGGAPGTFHQPAHGFGMKRAPKAAELSLSGPMTGEQKLGEGFLKPLRVTLEMRPNGRAERLICVS